MHFLDLWLDFGIYSSEHNISETLELVFFLINFIGGTLGKTLAMSFCKTLWSLPCGGMF